MAKHVTYLVAPGAATPGALLPVGPGMYFRTNPPIDFKELKRWEHLIGEELLDVEKTPSWRSYEYERADGSADPQHSEFEHGEYAMVVLDILAPIARRGVWLICNEIDGKLLPRAVGRGHAIRGTKWSQGARYAISDLENLPLMVDRLKGAVASDIQRLVNAVAL